MNLSGSLNHRIFRFFSTCMIILIFIVLTACETPRSRMRNRMKSVEDGLLPAVVFKGMEPEKMKLDKRMSYYRVPGVSLAVIYKNRIDWASAYGFKETGIFEPLTPDALFQAGAVSQSVAALTTLHFVEKGMLGLDSDVNSVLSTWKVPENQETGASRVTLRRLLNRSALFLPEKFKGYLESEYLPSLNMILQGEGIAETQAVRFVESAEGRFAYSEGGYAVLQQVLVDLEKKAFPVIAEKAVFQPIGMNNSTFVSPLPDSLKEKAVPGHLRGGETVEGKWLRYPVAAASGLWSTPTDLALFAIEVMKTARGESQQIVSPSLARTMLTPEEGIQGFGFYIEGQGDELFFQMSGYNTGYACLIIGYPARGEGAVIMTNSDNGVYLIDEIVRGISAVYEWPHFQPEVKPLYRLDPSVYPQYLGRYEINPDYILDVAHEDYFLVITPTGQKPTKFYAQGLTVFFSTDPYITIRFEKDDQGRVTGLILMQRGQSQRAKKIE